MPKIATKAGDNVFYRAREEVSSFNDRLRSREGAAEELGIDRTRLARIELGTIYPYPEEIAIMAEIYKAPELRNYFCAEICPLGCKTVPRVEGCCNIDRLAIKIMVTLNGISGVGKTILDIVSDGIVTPEEMETVRLIVGELEEVQIIKEELKNWVEKNSPQR